MYLHPHRPSVFSIANSILESYSHIRTNPAIALPRHLRPSQQSCTVTVPIARNSIAPDGANIMPQAAVLNNQIPQAEYVRLSLRLLHMVEFYMLIEFIEVIVAVIYGTWGLVQHAVRLSVLCE
jgi:hypothetical protein